MKIRYLLLDFLKLIPDLIKAIPFHYKLWIGLMALWEVVIFLPRIVAGEYARVSWTDWMGVPLFTLVLPYLLPKIIEYWGEKTSEAKQITWVAFAKTLMAIAVAMSIRDFSMLFFEDEWKRFVFHEEGVHVLNMALGIWMLCLFLFISSKRFWRVAVIAAVVVMILAIALYLFMGIPYLEQQAIEAESETGYYFDWGFRHGENLYVIAYQYSPEERSNISPRTILHLRNDEVAYDCAIFGISANCKSEVGFPIMNFHGYDMSKNGLESDNGKRFSSPADINPTNLDMFIYTLFDNREKKLAETGTEIEFLSQNGNARMPLDDLNCLIVTIGVPANADTITCP